LAKEEEMGREDAKKTYITETTVKSQKETTTYFSHELASGGGERLRTRGNGEVKNTKRQLREEEGSSKKSPARWGVANGDR